jgi:dolichol-phosphate mannosyltransferase
VVNRTLVIIPVFNEGEKVRKVLSAFPPDAPWDVLAIDDGSTDEVPEVIAAAGVRGLRNERNRGIGYSIRRGLHHALENGYEFVVVMAGNGKMQPSEIPQLLKPLEEGRADYVQGSRYLAGGRTDHLPRFRRFAIPVFTWIVRTATGFKGTDVTCGFRAYRTALLRDPQVNVDQDWLDRYELEYYLHYKAIRLGWRMAEAPVAMLYPESGKNYSKIKPFVSWWQMVRPWVFLMLGLKK